MRGENPPRLMDYSVIPIVWLPEIFSIGLVPDDLSNVKVVKVPFAINLRANIENITKVSSNSGYDNKVIAAQAIGFMVSEIQQELANMIALETDIDEVAKIVHVHPSYNEIIRSALEYAEGKAVDFYI